MIVHDRHGSGCVMVWWRTTMTGRTELHIWQGNVTGLYFRDNVSEPIVVPYARWHGNAFILRDDNSGAHRGCVVQNHTQFRRITFLQWPANPQTCFQLNVCGTSSGDKGHEWARWCTLGRFVPDASSNHFATHQEHEASLSRLPGGQWRPHSLLRLLWK